MERKKGSFLVVGSTSSSSIVASGSEPALQDKATVAPSPPASSIASSSPTASLSSGSAPPPPPPPGPPPPPNASNSSSGLSGGIAALAQGGLKHTTTVDKSAPDIECMFSSHNSMLFSMLILISYPASRPRGVSFEAVPTMRRHSGKSSLSVGMSILLFHLMILHHRNTKHNLSQKILLFMKTYLLKTHRSSHRQSQCATEEEEKLPRSNENLAFLELAPVVQQTWRATCRRPHHRPELASMT